MAVPNHLSIIEAVYAAGSYNLRTHDGCGRYIEACCIALHKADPRWGHLKKNPGQTQYNGHSHDGCLYLSDTPGQSVHVDMIASAESQNPAETPRPYWNPDIPRYSAADWYAPSGTGTGPTPPPVKPCPDPKAHEPKPVPPYPDEPGYWHGDGSYGAQVVKAYKDAFDAGKRPTPDPDWNAFIWYSRPGYAIGVGQMTKEQAQTEYIAELRRQLGV